MTRRQVTMFVLGAYWAQDPPREFFRIKAQTLAKKCKSDVKTPHFVGVECKVVNES